MDHNRGAATSEEELDNEAARIAKELQEREDAIISCEAARIELKLRENEAARVEQEMKNREAAVKIREAAQNEREKRMDEIEFNRLQAIARFAEMYKVLEKAGVARDKIMEQGEIMNIEIERIEQRRLDAIIMMKERDFASLIGDTRSK